MEEAFPCIASVVSCPSTAPCPPTADKGLPPPISQELLSHHWRLHCHRDSPPSRSCCPLSSLGRFPRHLRLLPSSGYATGAVAAAAHPGSSAPETPEEIPIQPVSSTRRFAELYSLRVGDRNPRLSRPQQPPAVVCAVPAVPCQRQGSLCPVWVGRVFAPTVFQLFSN